MKKTLMASVFILSLIFLTGCGKTNDYNSKEEVLSRELKSQNNEIRKLSAILEKQSIDIKEAKKAREQDRLALVAKAKATLAAKKVVVAAPKKTVCVDKTWTPSPATYEERKSFTQKSNCGRTRAAFGTKRSAYSWKLEETEEITITREEENDFQYLDEAEMCHHIASEIGGSDYCIYIENAADADPSSFGKYCPSSCNKNESCVLWSDGTTYSDDTNGSSSGFRYNTSLSLVEFTCR